MLDRLKETPISLSRAAKSAPVPVHISTIYRWYMRGVRGIKLETAMAGGRRVTTLEALGRFFEGTTAAADGAPPPSRTAKQRRRAIDQANKTLADAGIV